MASARSAPDIEWERPVCEKCGWTGDPAPILPRPDYATDEDERAPPEGECVLPMVPLRELRKPGRKNE